MADFILHIGRHKTGTTAIQRFLASNEDWLARHGYVFPKTGIRGYGHHDIAESMPKRKIRMITAQKTQKLISNLHREMEPKPGLTPILSSEAFQQRQPWIVRHYLGTRNIKVIVYLRNHLSYLPSAYTQKVHATSYSGTLKDFYQGFYKRTDYRRFIRSWERSFPGQVNLRIYDQSQLFEENIVADFVREALDIPEEIPTAQAPLADANPSLNAKIVQFKRLLNETGEVDRYPSRRLYYALPKLNRHFPAPKTSVTPELASELLKQNAKRDRKVAERYFERTELFSHANEPVREECHITTQEIENMKERLAQIIGPI